ncbi:type VI secretion system ImpA family N-terminal domain-containing protein [Pseudomonas petrae]|uniref:Type VI secretion system ImpA family N-terminal domain-containing protein n=1 Tax=Pseudomonas petrae TaxID=2912190 RepID=A0ABS9I1R2_9PSED|nr:type VI secretion system ImpA family N-terminal domain-containing protein [Pseudomonas petrae]MCF7532394.1 type VI secretion system ImpA family N-terminal domain-containing protein [Pseudomonas petrae]MCF7536028.1 type VI secretion system ImpA family N-terminal domain-containing protein [Pseudomonas petrae]MCF7541747.1 type VI secretion system ImpA family N-terminal domain-containing protein [Pseudomonas petrae]MCF7557590.1 type VI secretion system ImpA family N-terminal domain-containing pr
MTKGVAMGIRAGGDPRALPDYRTLCTEMARLGHPACPDVDWQSIEQCCLALFAGNGADLQTAAAYALARSHLAGMDGMSEGVAVLETLSRGDAKPWPRGVSARAEILSGLFGSWQAVLREMEINICDLAGLGLLKAQLEQLRSTLVDQNPASIMALEGLLQQIGQRASRLEREAQAVVLVAPDGRQRSSSHSALHSPSQSCPGRTPPTVAHHSPRIKKRRALWIGWLAAALFGLILALAPRR